MRILFAGSPGIAVPSLEALVALQMGGTDYRLVGVLTNPDRQKGRRGIPEPTEVSLGATRLSEQLQQEGYPGIPQFKPEKLFPEVQVSLSLLKPDLLVSFAYGHIFKPEFLALFPLGGINIHPSLLPAYRGASPIQAAILNRDRETGITIQTIALGMDTGNILLQERFSLNGRETTGILQDIAAQKAAALLPAVLQDIAQGSSTGEPQDPRKASYCFRIAKEDGAIDWSWSAEGIDAQIRAFTPWPLSWTLYRETALYILEAAPYQGPALFQEKDPQPGRVLGIDKQGGILVQTGDGILGITQLQYQAKRALDWRSFLNGARGFLNALLG